MPVTRKQSDRRGSWKLYVMVLFYPGMHTYTIFVGNRTLHPHGVHAGLVVLNRFVPSLDCDRQVKNLGFTYSFSLSYVYHVPQINS